MSELPPDGSNAALEKKRKVETDFVSADFGTPLIDEAASSRPSLPTVTEINPQVGNSLIITVPSQFLARSAFETNRFTSPFDLQQPGDANRTKMQDYKDVRTAAAMASVPGERLSAVVPVVPVVPVTASDVIKPITVNNTAAVRADEVSQAKSYVPSETVQIASAQRSIDPALMPRTIDRAVVQRTTDQTLFAPIQASTDLRQQPDSRLLETATFKNPAAVSFAVVDTSVERQHTIQQIPQIGVAELPRSILAKPQDMPTLDAPGSADRLTSYATRNDLIAAFNRDPSPQILTRTEPQITSYKQQDFKQDFNPGYVPNKFESSQDGVIAAKRALIEQPGIDFDTSRLSASTLGASSKSYDDLMRLRVDAPPNSIGIGTKTEPNRDFTMIGTAKPEPNRDFTLVGSEARVSSVDGRSIVDRQQLQTALDGRAMTDRFQQPSTLDARAITEARTQQLTLDPKPLDFKPQQVGTNTLAAAGFDARVQQPVPVTTQISEKGGVTATFTQTSANTFAEIRQQPPAPVATNIVRGLDQPTNVTTALAKPPVSDAAVLATPRTVLPIADKSLPQTVTAGTATITAPTTVKMALAGEKVSSTSATPVPLPTQLSDRVASLVGGPNNERPVARLQTSDSLTTRTFPPVALTSQLNVLPADRIAASLPGASGSRCAIISLEPTIVADRARLTPAINTLSGASAIGERGLNITSAIAAAASSKVGSLLPDRVPTAIPITTGERHHLTALPANANGISINLADKGLVRTTGSVAGEKVPANLVATSATSERSIKGIDLGHSTTNGANHFTVGDRSAAAAATSIAGRPIGRELGLGVDIRNGALPEKGQIQFGLASDKVVPLGGKLIAFKPLHEISENDKRYLLGLELAIGAVALAAVARARATEGREGAEEEEEKDGDEQVASNSDDYDTNVIQRPRHLVQPGETLQTIAEEYYADANLAWLLLALNKGKLSESWNGDVCYVEVAGRQELELPVREDISAFYRSTSHKFKGKRLVTTVRQSTMDQELVTLAFRNVVGHPTRRLQSASS
ncbi:MAG: hypothetical protein U0105_14355 [Candidatus Obscuribacterales bacterium]